MIGQSLPPAYNTKVWAAPLVLFLIFGAVGFLFAILMTFYFFPTFGIRFIGNHYFGIQRIVFRLSCVLGIVCIAAVVTHVINFISHIVLNTGYSYSYLADTTGTLPLLSLQLASSFLFSS
jgi:mannose/fructose/N-acetylgalactosamine-specific phosphotransferase system component IID